LAGVKKPRLLRFFSILTNSFGSMDRFAGVTAAETEGAFGVRTEFRILGGLRLLQVVDEKS